MGMRWRACSVLVPLSMLLTLLAKYKLNFYLNLYIRKRTIVVVQNRIQLAHPMDRMRGREMNDAHRSVFQHEVGPNEPMMPVLTASRDAFFGIHAAALVTTACHHFARVNIHPLGSLSASLHFLKVNGRAVRS